MLLRSKKELFDFMLIKAGLLSEGIYFSDELLNRLRNQKKVTEGTGLFRYNDQKTAPNEIARDQKPYLKCPTAEKWLFGSGMN